MSRALRFSLCLAIALTASLALPLFVPTATAGDGKGADACHGCHNGCVNCRDVGHGHPDLFYNYYVPGTCGGVPASMYLAPRPVPPNVGHTYITYQPLMPHELLYEHKRYYYRYYNGGRGMTRTRVEWYTPTSHKVMHGIRNHFRLAR